MNLNLVPKQARCDEDQEIENNWQTMALQEVAGSKTKSWEPKWSNSSSSFSQTYNIIDIQEKQFLREVPKIKF